MCYHHFWVGQYQDRNACVLRAPLIQLKYTLKHWKSTFSYSNKGSEPLVFAKFSTAIFGLTFAFALASPLLGSCNRCGQGVEELRKWKIRRIRSWAESRVREVLHVGRKWGLGSVG